MKKGDKVTTTLIEGIYTFQSVDSENMASLKPTKKKWCWVKVPIHTVKKLI